ncbi:MAG: efflux RND transporter periplasmic adaptor subunit [Magnetococcales bacterium]|nr:efflux RND transporter periplasmic adaptor subunit [Magnetococcales bacterium]
MLSCGTIFRAVLAGSFLVLTPAWGAGDEHAGHGESHHHADAAPNHADKNPRKILYYRNPMGLPDTSPTPKKDSMGMDYVPVYADAPAPEKAKPSATHPGNNSPRKVLYYRNPMGLPDTSPTPKKDNMGMDYVPVYAEDAAPTGSDAVRIDLDKVQKLGVKTEMVAWRPMTRSIRAVGTVQVDERKLHIVTQKYEGWIEKLFANTTGQSVRRGEPLMEVYSPALVVAQQEYLAAFRARERLQDADAETRDTAGNLAESALTRLRNWDISEDQIKQLQARGKAGRSMTVHAPVSGVILEKGAIQGMRFMPGDMLYRIADLSTIWVMADIFEQDVGLVRQGQIAEVTLSAMPGKRFSGKVAFIHPTLTTETRTVKVRIEMPNPGGLLRPALYATVVLSAPTDDGAVMTVPDSAVLDSGSRQVVLVERGEGLYEPRPVRMGGKGGGFTEIMEGVKAGEKVVVRANFLIDAEANLRAALGHFSH